LFVVIVVFEILLCDL